MKALTLYLYTYSPPFSCNYFLIYKDRLAWVSIPSLHYIYNQDIHVITIYFILFLEIVGDKCTVIVIPACVYSIYALINGAVGFQDMALVGD